MRALGVPALAGAIALSGCGGSSSAEPQVLPTVQPSSAAATTAAPSVSPSGKDAPTPEGAAAFARFVYAEIERAFVARDPSIVEAVSTPGCVSCKNFIESIKGVRDGNGRVEGYRIDVRVAVAPGGTGQTARVDIIRDSTANIEYDRAGRVVSKEPGLRGIEEQMNLVRVNESWRVANIIRIRVRG